MNPDLVTGLLATIGTRTGRPAPVRHPVRVWTLSGVERLTFPDGGTAIYKYAARPFTGEDRALRAAARAGVPVPTVLGSALRDGTLGMLLEDLGEPVREARDADGLTAAIILHAAAPDPALTDMTEATLGALPSRALGHLRRLRKGGRWAADEAGTAGTADLGDLLGALARAASARAKGVTMPPWGWAHSEFHPTSLHIGPSAWHLLDFARAFNGPGLLDLASWHGTLDAADPDRLRAFIESYVAAGGNRGALAERGGLRAEAWALGWHRVWAVEWFMEQAVRWINDPDSDPAYISVVRRHLRDAVRLLEP
jgi:hypothetical protein